MITRRKTNTVKVGNVKIGSNHPVVIQSMAKTDTKNIKATVKEINVLEKEGCELIRVAVKDMEGARAIREIKKEINIPLIADIHFNYKLAMEAIIRGADKIRVNPGNIYKKEELNKVISLSGEKKVPIRVGINSGSLPKAAGKNKELSDRMVSSLLKYLEYFEKKNFSDLIISLKASDVVSTIEAYRKVSKRCDYPLHLGVTAAGLPEDGTVKSSIGIGALLVDGLGDTIRVSLTGDSSDEIRVAKKILSSLNLRKFGPEIIACPTCGRCQVDLISIVKDLDRKLKRYTTYDIRHTKKPLIIALMGCEVNGPGEAKEADIGIAFGKDQGAIFKKGRIIKTVKAKDAINELLRLIGGWHGKA